VTSTVAIRPDANQRCRTCGARVLWIITEQLRKKMPLNADPDPAGRFVLAAGAEGEPPTAIYVGEQEAREGEPRYVSHFATCPDRKDWRKPE
jgi:hypothetical protein